MKVMPEIGWMKIQLKRYEHVGRRAEIAEIETRRHDADYGVGIAAQRNRLADDLGVAGIAPVPESVTEHHDFFPCGRSSSRLKVRPRTGVAPNRRKKSALTCAD